MDLFQRESKSASGRLALRSGEVVLRQFRGVRLRALASKESATFTSEVLPRALGVSRPGKLRAAAPAYFYGVIMFLTFFRVRKINNKHIKFTFVTKK